ncbi:MAG: chloride channel protein, partial [Bacteroidales bacterium]|nr:chloride channel protein [Bacteroidales bacterium]
LLFTAVFLVKVFAMTATNSGGGNGGTFGPTLFCGAVAGFAVARCFNLAGASLPEQNFVLTGMAALMAGVMQAPMTAIFLIAEISGGYALLIPLTLASTAAYGTVRFFNNYSIYSKRIAQSGDLLTHDSDQAVLTLMHTRDLIRDKYPRLILGASLRELVAAASESTAAVIAITDAEGKFQGLIDLGNVRKYLLQTELYDSLKVENIMEEAPATLGEDEKMESVMSKFDSTGAWRLPVLDRERRYLGFISRSRLLTAYRNELRAISNSD